VLEIGTLRSTWRGLETVPLGVIAPVLDPTDVAGTGNGAPEVSRRTAPAPDPTRIGSPSNPSGAARAPPGSMLKMRLLTWLSTSSNIRPKAVSFL
jgi:hypothetical protein